MRLEIGNLSIVNHSSNDVQQALTEPELNDFLRKAKLREDWISTSADSVAAVGKRVSAKKAGQNHDAYASRVDYRGHDSAKVELHSDDRHQPFFVLHQDPQKESKLKFINFEKEPDDQVPDLIARVYSMCKNFLRSKDFLLFK